MTMKKSFLYQKPIRSIDSSPALYWLRLYWFIRIGMTLLWIWTAYVSWFVYPHAESLEQLSKVGFTPFEVLLFAAACLMDAVMGLATALKGSKFLWALQICLVVGYSVVIGWGLPEFLFQPFGPITKNFAVLACLVYLYGMDKR